jgi:nucleoside-diphosphate-sugar epimerase
MPDRKTVLVAGATGLVGRAAMKRFAVEPGTGVVAVSRRRPDETFGARFVPLDLGDAAAVEAAVAAIPKVTHLVYAALYEEPGGLVAGWREARQIATNDRMLRNLFGALERHAAGLVHVTLLQGTKAYGVHVRPIPMPAREDRDEARDIPNFYWEQEDYVRERQRASGGRWHFTVLRPVLIVGRSTGSAMNVVPAIGAWAAMLREGGERVLPFPGGAPRAAQAIDADLLADVITWSGETAVARGQAFNVTNGDAFTWPAVWPAIARSLGMEPGPHVPTSLVEALSHRHADWDALVKRHGLVAPGLDDFVGLSVQYADYTMGLGRTEPGEPRLVSTVKLTRAGFHGALDTEDMFAKWFREFQDARLLPRMA